MDEFATYFKANGIVSVIKKPAGRSSWNEVVPDAGTPVMAGLIVKALNQKAREELEELARVESFMSQTPDGKAPDA